MESSLKELAMYRIVIPAPAKNSSPREKKPYICGLRARIECEPLSEHSTHSDRVTNIGLFLSWGASLPLAFGNTIYYSAFGPASAIFLGILGYFLAKLSWNILASFLACAS